MSRTEYHREFYRRNVEKRRAQRLASKYQEPFVSWEKGEEALAMAEQKAINEAQRERERQRNDRRLRELSRRERLQREIEAIVWRVS